MLDPESVWIEERMDRLASGGTQPISPEMTRLLAVPTVSVSAALIVRDEEQCLKEILMALRHAVDEIVVVDTGSVDNTACIAKQSGAKVYSFDWCDDFSEARNFALSKVTSNWVLCVDADERLHPDDVASVHRAAGLLSLLDQPVIGRVVIMDQIGHFTLPNYVAVLSNEISVPV
ncbi:glycosyltransferase family 2 protein [Alicyclobacillus dauci]|uniref:Glycosyltransferase family 2 protein n=1 Tax=Alicyclobacillus dauci TaxID=1475485 RepID=A0ABY6YYT5_9BACL|nr:glycosyltransferase family 2 protein [Alicyclobacillus dauci]WAH35433.1 glycosyltransferase family 2 protein [Alicyclobacillus dauci]